MKEQVFIVSFHEKEDRYWPVPHKTLVPSFISPRIFRTSKEAKRFAYEYSSEPKRICKLYQPGAFRIDFGEIALEIAPGKIG